MRKPLFIAAVAGSAAVITIAAVSLRSSSDASIDPVSATPRSAVEEDASLRAARPPSLDANRSLSVPDRVEPSDAVRERPGGERGPNGRRDRRRQQLGDSPMKAEDWSVRFEEFSKRRKGFMERFDADGDGKISDSERGAMRQAMREGREQRMLERFDEDGDGVLNDEERLNAEAELEARRMERQIRMVERFDTDGDGVLSDAENQAARERFSRGRGDQAQGGWQQTIEKYDADGDGELNLDESYKAYLDRFDQRTRREFVRRYDGNNDGAIDAADFDTFLESYQNKDESSDINGDGIVDERDVEQFRDLMIATSP